MADGRGVMLEQDIASDIGMVRADADRMQQVIWNLLSNAVKFTPSGGRVKVMAQRSDGTLRITVTDTGMGISKEFQPFIFQRFSQAEPASTRQHGGLGLGLAIAKQIVELHGGSIGVSSEGEGEGSTFFIVLPIVPGDGSAVTLDRETDNPMAACKLAGLDILVVEDDAASLNIIKRLLEAAGASVRSASSTAAALMAYQDHQPDLVLSDIGMPGEDGYALLRALRIEERRRGLRHTPAIAITAFASQEDRTLAFDAGFDDHLSKPVDPDLLLKVIMGLAGKMP